MLLNPTATTTEILRDVDATFPQSRSTSAMMQASKAKFRLHVASARPYMVPQRHGKPTSFSSLDDDIEDEAWDTDVRDEPSIDDQAPDGLDMDKSLLVKPVGTMNASFVLAGSHLTVDTTTHL